MQVGPYTPGIIQYDYKTPLYNEGLIAKVLGYKQEEFNTAFSKLQNLKQQALDIKFLHKDGQSRIDQYNKKLSETFDSGKDFGDLSDPDIERKYVNMYNELSRDINLIGLYNKDKEYQRELSAIQAYKKAKDPYKAGWSPVNEAVWNKQKGGLEDYLSSNMQTAKDMSAAKYTPYYDIRPELSSLMKDVHYEGSKITYRDGTGNLITEELKELSPDKIKQNFYARLSPNAMKQLEVESDYEYFQNKDAYPDTFKEVLHKSYTANYNANLSSLTKQIEDTKGKLEYIKDRKDQESLDLKATYASNLTKLEELHKDAYKQANTPYAEFLAKTDDELLQTFRGLNTEAKLTRLANGMSYRIQSKEMSNDAAFWADRNLDFKYKELALDEAYRNKALELKARENGTTAVGGVGTNEFGAVYAGGTTDNLLTEPSIHEKIGELNTKVAGTTDDQYRKIAAYSQNNRNYFSNNAPSTIEEQAIKAYIDATDKEVTPELLKTFVGELRQGKAKGFESYYNQIVQTDALKGMLNTEVDNVWSNAKLDLLIDPNSQPNQNGEFTNKAGETVTLDQLRNAVNTRMNNSPLQSRTGRVRLKVNKDDYNGKEAMARQEFDKYFSKASKYLGSKGITMITPDMVDLNTVTLDGRGNLSFKTRGKKSEDDLSFTDLNIELGSTFAPLEYGKEYKINVPELSSSTNEYYQMAVALKAPVVELYKGFKVTLKPTSEGNINVIIRKPDGSLISDGQEHYEAKNTVDIEAVLTNVKRSIDGLVK